MIVRLEPPETIQLGQLKFKVVEPCKIRWRQRALRSMHLLPGARYLIPALTSTSELNVRLLPGGRIK